MYEDFIKLYIADVSVFEDDSLYKKAYDSASLTRRKKVDALRFARDKRLSLGAECLLKFALSNEGITDFEYKYDSNGKPFIDDNLHFSLSHSGEIAICAISNHPVGCDIEIIKSARLKVAKKFFTKAELDLLENDADTTFYRIWTAKESFIKCIGLGLKLPLNSFETDICKGKILYNNHIYHLKEFNLSDKYSGYVCSGNDVPTEFIEVDLSKN